MLTTSEFASRDGFWASMHGSDCKSITHFHIFRSNFKFFSVRLLRNREIFELFKERNAWWERKKALDAKQNDPNRYNNRGGQLLQEEKERKLADVKIPKIEKRIAALAEAYNEKTKRQFTINGDSLVDLMERDWDNYRGSKEILKSARKAVATPSHMAKTPRTPMSSHAHMSMKRIASTTRYIRQSPALASVFGIFGCISGCSNDGIFLLQTAWPCQRAIWQSDDIWKCHRLQPTSHRPGKRPTSPRCTRSSRTRSVIC